MKNRDTKTISEMTKKELEENKPDGWTYTNHNGHIHIKENGQY